MALIGNQGTIGMGKEAMIGKLRESKIKEEQENGDGE